MSIKPKKTKIIAKRFRGLLPIVVDVETTGVDANVNGLLEIAGVSINMNEHGQLLAGASVSYNIEPFLEAELDARALEVTGIDPLQPLRLPIPEKQAVASFFSWTRKLLDENKCHRAVLVGHNAFFDLGFIQAAATRCYIKRNPFHSFTVFDTATLAAATLGETVLARAMRKAGLPFNLDKAHNALYDAEKTADLFCYIINNLE